MIIILTNKDDVTVDFVVRELQKQNLKYYRLNTEDIPDTVKICFDVKRDIYQLYDNNKNMLINLQDVSSVYYRRPSISDLSSVTNTSKQEKNYLQSELIYILEGIYKVLECACWVNNVYRIREAENKLFQIKLAREIGFDVPDSIISNDTSFIDQMLSRNNKDCIIKSIKSGNIKDGKKVIYTSKIDTAFSLDRDRINVFPVYLQKNIHKLFDLRCIVVGNNIYCAKIDSQTDESSEIDWRRGPSYLPHESYELPYDIKQKCKEITREMGLIYSAIDMVVDENGKHIFLECNPNGQWAWLETRLGFPISQNIISVLVNGI